MLAPCGGQKCLHNRKSGISFPLPWQWCRWGVINWDRLLTFAYSVSPLHSWKTTWPRTVPAVLVSEHPAPDRGVTFCSGILADTHFLLRCFTVPLLSVQPAAAVSPRLREVRASCSVVGHSAASPQLTQLASELTLRRLVVSHIFDQIHLWFNRSYV